MLSRGLERASLEGNDTRWMLAEAMSRALEHDAGSTGESRILRLEVPAGDLDPLRWLGAQAVRPRSFWEGREDGIAVAAVGAADVVESDGPADDASLRDRLALLRSRVAGARYYGGLRFDPGAHPGEEWGQFGGYRFVLPRFELCRRGDETVLACNLILPRDADKAREVLEEVEGLSLPGDVPGHGDSLPIPVSRADKPDLEGWRENVGSALAAFAAGGMDKVVLARRVEFGFEEEIDAVVLMHNLRAATPDCFHFLVEPEEGAAFVGASPERLFRREGREISSEAVAGTRPRGASAAGDAELRDELLGSAKDQAEHSFVRISIRKSLGALCGDLEVEDKASEMKLARGRHLVSRIRGTLGESVTDAEVLAALHPTPAVGGYPKDRALEEIRALEPFDRGWYAGPVGWFGSGDAEFAVGIRSGLVRGGTLALYSGAGIVVGSTPEGEWAEIEQKISDFTKVFGLDPEEHDTGS